MLQSHSVTRVNLTRGAAFALYHFTMEDALAPIPLPFRQALEIYVSLLHGPKPPVVLENARARTAAAEFKRDQKRLQQKRKASSSSPEPEL